MENENKMIRNAVKKPIFPMSEKRNLLSVITDEGSVNGEDYKILITYPHIMLNNEALNVKYF